MRHLAKWRSWLCMVAFGLSFLSSADLAAETFKNPLLVNTGSNPFSLSVGDFNGDGKDDLVYADSSGLHVLLGNGNGTFTKTQDIPLSLLLDVTITVADVNGDGELDLLFGGSTTQPQINVLLGKGDGTFSSVLVSVLPVHPSLNASLTFRMGVADFNKDGAADIVVSDTQNEQMYVALGNNTGRFTLGSVIYEPATPRDVSTGDFNGDGNEDFIVQGGLGADVRVFLGKGDGTFQPAVVYGGTTDLGIESVILADMDGDGHLDMVVSTQTNEIQILHGNADGTFVAASGGATLNSFPLVMAVADFNSDGIPDLAVEDSSGLNILLGTGNLNYATPVPYSLGISAKASAIGDFNGDGHPDFALTATGGITLLLGTASGALQSFAVYDIGQATSSIASADFNGDHIFDIAAAEGSTGPGILVGKGDGTFTMESNTAITGGTGSVALAGDFNGDGKVDLYFTGNSSSGVVLFGNGNGTFGPPVDLTQFQQVGFVAGGAGDFNNDKRTDLVSLNNESYGVLLGQSNETFTLVTAPLSGAQSFIAPAIGDFNKDGRLDMMIAQLTSVQLLLGNGDGTFTLARSINIGLPGNYGLCGASALAAADLDGDGNLDLVIAVGCGDVAEILYGNGDGTFQDPVQLPLEQTYSAVSVADLNGDHLPDLIFSNQGMIGIVHNAGNRTYSGETHYLPGTVGNIVVQDFNGDGFPDIAVASAGTTVSVLLNQASGALTTGTLTVQPEPSTFTKPFTMSLTLQALKSGTGTPTGTVTFSVDGSSVGTVSLTSGVASYTYHSASLLAGQHTISAAYSGDANFVPSYFGRQHQIIPIVHATTITLTATPTTVLAGQTVSFQAQVTSPGQTPYGTVSFLDGTTPMGSMDLDATSSAVFDTALLSSGKHSVTAYFIGNQNFASVTSSPVNITVNATKTTTTVTVQPTTVAVGASVVLTAKVDSSAGTPTGSVLFYDGSSPLQNTALDGTGTAVYGTTFSTAGTHVISASYLANASFAASTSSSVNVNVTAGASANATVTSLSATASSSVAHGFSFTAFVKGLRGSRNGSVTFLDGQSSLGTSILDSAGTGVYQSVSLNPGVHYISAFFSGTATAQASVSQVLIETIPADVPDFSITASPTSVVLGDAAVNVQLSVKAVSGFSQAVTLTCATGTPNLTCGIQPATLAGGAGRANLTITIAGQNRATTNTNSRSVFILTGLFPPLFLVSWWLRRTRPRRTPVLALLLGTLAVGCGSPVMMTPEIPASYLVTVTGKSLQVPGSIVHAVSVQAQITGRGSR